LLADDSITIRSMVAGRVERSGYEVAQASDGEEPLELRARLSASGRPNRWIWLCG
jgi:DNA-binding response OmpR family regulator